MSSPLTKKARFVKLVKTMFTLGGNGFEFQRFYDTVPAKIKAQEIFTNTGGTIDDKLEAFYRRIKRTAADENSSGSLYQRTLKSFCDSDRTHTDLLYFLNPMGANLRTNASSKKVREVLSEYLETGAIIVDNDSPQPRRRRSSPPRRRSSPPRRRSSPPRRAASPPRRRPSPPRRAASPPRRAASPPSRAASPPKQKSPSPKSADCPCKHKQPHRCVDKKDYFKQTRIFHPDKNSGCVKMATEKFKKLEQLCAHVK